MMVGKVIGTGSGFRGVVNYLLAGKKDDPNPDRVSWVGFRNMLTEDPQDVPALMRATANQSTRCKSPVYHYAISWHRDHTPSDDLMRDIADATLKDLGLEEHQVFLMAHDDTAHRHVHIIANRVHPETTKAWSNGHDYRRLEISLRKQAETRGLPYVPGKFNDPDKFGTKGKRPRDGEYQANVRHGKPEPKPMWSREDIKQLRGLLGPTFAEATSWDDLNTRIAALGFRLSPKGQGVVIEGADGFMKLSDLNKQVRMIALEEAYRETFTSFVGRRRAIPDEALKPGAGLLGDNLEKIADPGQLSRLQTARNPLHSPHEGDDGDDNGATDDAVRGEARRAWSERRIRLPRAIKPSATNTDDDVPMGGIPHPDADPQQLAYHRVRAARAVLAKAKRDRLQGHADLQHQLNAQLELEDARRALDELINERRSERPPARTPIVPKPTAISDTRKDKSQSQRHSETTKHRSADERGEAFGGLRAARQAHDMAVALFNAGVITKEELESSAKDVQRAAEELRPHLTLGETLDKDIADALRKLGRKPAPKKNGPSR